MPVDFLTTEQVESYGRFTGEPDELQLARYFHLDEADKEFIGKSRGDHNRLGIALQIGCVRFLGTFLTDMNHIPSGVRHFTARQLGIRDITVLAEYGQRENTRREHAALIRQHYQYREFASALDISPYPSFIYPELDKQRTSWPAFRPGDRVAYATSYYSPRSHHADPVDFRGKGKGDVAPVEQTGTDTVSRTAFTAGDAAGAN